MDFIKSFSTYCKEADFGSIYFWAFPVLTLAFIWLATVAGVKLFKTRKRVKTIFVINRAWIASSLIAAAILIGLICYWWSINFFAQQPYQLSLIISLTIAMLIPVFAQVNLCRYYSADGVKEITDQPKTLNQLESVIVFTKKQFRANKLFLLIPLLGFLLLFFYFNQKPNLIALVFDNSSSMQSTTAHDALSETFDNLDENNEIVLTTMEGYKENDAAIAKKTIKDIMSVSKSSNLRAGNVVPFSNPAESKAGLSQISNECLGSPICESVWKTHLFIKETKANQEYGKKLLIVITDGEDNFLGESLNSGNFFFDSEQFAQQFPPENVFIIDYSQKERYPFVTRCETEGCDVYPAENNKQAYLDALDNALQSFKNNWYLIYWTIFIFSVFALIMLLIPAKKIV